MIYIPAQLAYHTSQEVHLGLSDIASQQGLAHSRQALAAVLSSEEVDAVEQRTDLIG